MSTTKDYCNFILEQLRDLADIDFRPMMGEYLLYYRGFLFGGIYDNRLLVKKTNTNAIFNLPEAVPYEKAKLMYQIEDLDDCEKMKTVILATYQGLIK